MSLFTGSGVALVTPFNDDGSINYEAYEKLINFNIENGTDAIIACGTTGEASTLTDEEQIEAIKFACEVTKKRVPVIAGAGSNHTAHGIELCKKSMQAGADGLLIVKPYYNKNTNKYSESSRRMYESNSGDMTCRQYNIYQVNQTNRKS